MLLEQRITDNGIEEVDKVAVAIERLRYFEPDEGYWLCFSGGKDSQCLLHLAQEAGVKFEAHYNVTGIDPPELIYFMKENYPGVIFDMYKKSMWRLIAKKGLPTRLARFCCSELKEHGGEGMICLTGIRWAESNQRKSRKPFEVYTKKKADKKLFNDNDEDRQMFENCMQKGKKIVNPIIDWDDEDVWEYIRMRKLKYCKLYDEGWKRIGCIGCPMASLKQRKRELEKYPKFKDSYMRAITRFLPGYLERKKTKGLIPQFTTPEEMYDWWMSDHDGDKGDPDQDVIFE